jgi:MSHA biogenesis protein MshN
VSVINKMLQDLDRRNAVGVDGAPPAAHSLKVVVTRPRGHEWFWRVLALLVLISVAWVGWVAYQLQPRLLVTPLAMMAYENRGSGRIAVEKAPAIPAPIPVAAAAEAPAFPPAPAPTNAVEPEATKAVQSRPETFKLARSIETPIPEAKSRPTKGEAKKPAAQALAPAEPGPSAGKTVLDKRDRSKPVNEAAESRFRRAAALLREARLSEAEEQLAAALQADPSHVPARQAYVVLLLEQNRVGSALRVLREALEANPAQPTFALALARIHAEQREYQAALEVLDKAGSGQGGAQVADIQALRAVVLQRLGRHADAASAYQDALQSSVQPPGTWTGFGITLEALGRRGEAAQAYQRALTAGPMSAELRDYTETRLKALQ